MDSNWEAIKHGPLAPNKEEDMAVAQTAGEAKRHPLYDALEATRGGGLEPIAKAIAAEVL